MSEHILKRMTGSIDDQNNLGNYLETIHKYWIDVNGREIWIQGFETDPAVSRGEEPGVEYNMATRVIKNLHILKNINSTEPVTIHLHTCGGYVEEGMAIYDTIKLMPYKVKMISYTHARSMSSFILQAADERLLLPNSYFMFHDGTTEVGGTNKVVYSAIEFNKKIDERLNKIYVDALSRKGKFKDWLPEKISEMLRDLSDKKEDVFLSAEEAVEWGFADGILNTF